MALLLFPVRGGRRGATGLLPVLEAMASARTDFDLNELDPRTVAFALRNGLGAVLSHVSSGVRAQPPPPSALEIRAADLTARLLTAEMGDAVEEILAAPVAADCRPILIKGAALSRLYYPAPHLRTMGDIDILVAPARAAAFEDLLRRLGFRQSSPHSIEHFKRHHHSMPFWHPGRQVWVEVHTRLFSPRSPFADDPVFLYENLAANLESLAIGAREVLVMSHELRLVYACARWAEMLDTERGLYAVLDVILLLQRQIAGLDWDHIFAWLRNSGTVTAVHLMLGYMSRWGLAAIPGEVLQHLASMDRCSNSLSRAILHGLFHRFVVRGIPFGRLVTSSNIRIIWWTLMRPSFPAFKLLSLPYYLVFPPAEPRRFDPSFLLKRFRSAIRRNS